MRLRHVGSAPLYGNTADVREAMRESGLRRDAVFVLTNLWNNDQGYDSVLRAFDASLQKLGFNVLDLYLPH